LRRIGLYSLIAFTSLALVGILAAGIGSALNSRDEETRVAQATPPRSPNPRLLRQLPKRQKRSRRKSRNPPQSNRLRRRPPSREWREIAQQREAEEQEAAEQAATAVPPSTALNLTVPKIGLQNNPVTNSISESVLANGAGKIPSTGFPWQPGANTYIAAHVYGYPGTGSWQ
jgi:sortase A